MNKKEMPLKVIYDRLLADKKVINQSDFATAIEFDATPVSNMLRGLKPVNYRLLVNLHKKFKINTNFIINDGHGSIYDMADQIDQLTAKIDQLQAENNKLYDQVDSLINTLKTLQHQDRK